LPQGLNAAVVQGFFGNFFRVRFALSILTGTIILGLARYIQFHSMSEQSMKYRMLDSLRHFKAALNGVITV